MLNPNGAAVLSVVNLKGGVGKTTTAVHLAVSLSRNAKVLLIDLDLQASASLYMGLTRHDLKPGVAEWLYGEFCFLRTSRETLFPNLTLLPASSSLRQFEQQFSSKPAYLYRIKRRIDEVKMNYDYIILDCPPSFSLITLNALSASHYFIAPIAPQYMGFEATKDLFSLLEELKQFYRVPFAKCLGVLLTLNKKNKTALEVSQMIQREFGGLCFSHRIDASPRIEIASHEKRTIFDWAGKSQIAQQYWNFTTEVKERLTNLATVLVEKPLEKKMFSTWKEDSSKLDVKPLQRLGSLKENGLISFPKDAQLIEPSTLFKKWTSVLKRYIRA